MSSSKPEKSLKTVSALQAYLKARGVPYSRNPKKAGLENLAELAAELNFDTQF